MKRKLLVAITHTDVTAADDVRATQIDIHDVTTDRSTSVPHSRLHEKSLNFIREISGVPGRLFDTEQKR